ncbi:hypothetical protein [Priestia megaterium]|nr:hypothetical protein [Priestia megaterium]MDH3169383.1 hypothetical protein [Priestia megaterium]
MSTAFGLVGSTFLMLLLKITMPTMLLAVSLGISLILNIAGTAILMQFLKHQKKTFNQSFFISIDNTC